MRILRSRTLFELAQQATLTLFPLIAASIQSKVAVTFSDLPREIAKVTSEAPGLLYVFVRTSKGPVPNERCSLEVIVLENLVAN